MGEQINETQLLEETSTKRYEFDLLQRPQLGDVIRNLVKDERFEMVGGQLYTDARELLYLTHPPEVAFARSLLDAREKIAGLLQGFGYLCYITGGLEGIYLSIAMNGIATDDRIQGFIVGLEDEEYIRNKGREPIFTLQEKVSLWKELVPSNSVVFVVPPKPEMISPNSYYDWLAQEIGIWKHPKVVYIGAEDDPREIKEAHERRAYLPDLCFNISLGDEPIHVSQLLQI